MGESMEDFELVDIENWKRKQHYLIFRQCQQPRYDISFELDITNFYQRVHEEQLSFTLAMIYAISTCANEIEEFRYRFKDGEVVKYKRLKLSFSYLNKETELLKVVVVEPKDNIFDFVHSAKEIADHQEVYFTGPMGNDIYQFSAIPWISYTHISHTDSGRKDNAVPMFDWGKYFFRNDRLILPFSIQAHHSFVDGIHMGKLAQRLQEFLDTY